jgi:hypothetical protein
MSRIFIPAHMKSDVEDARALGIAISCLWLNDEEIGLDEPCLTQGWHAPERDWRWTNGDALIATWGAHDLAFEVALIGTYWLELQECCENRTA